MFTTVLWATDGSPDAERALPVAARLAHEEHASLHVVHVVEKMVGGRATGLDRRADEPEVYARVRAEMRRLSGEDLHPVMHLPYAVSGEAAGRIAGIAREVGADVIVIGSRGHGSLTGVMLGSITQKLLHLAPCPVLAIPPTAVAGPAPAEQTTSATTPTAG